jgi:hypothetical protein
MIKHAYQGSTDAAFDIFQELVERYKAMQPAKMQPCAGRNCGSTDPNLHSAECFEDYEKVTGMNRQEPVAWKMESDQAIWFERTDPEATSTLPRDVTSTPLYTAPPQREWQGLTDEDMQGCIKTADYRQGQYKRTPYWAHLASAIEAKLREKNNG